MQRDLILAALVVALGASGTYLLLPHRHRGSTPGNAHRVGAAVSGVALLLFTFFLTPVRPVFLSGLFFYAFALASIAGAVLTVTSTNPVHSALWFASVVLSTSGLFLLAGAQFLAAGTVIVYAGAIIVTFLFVIMLAQMEGRAPYDRSARMPFRATWTCFMLLFGILWSLLHVPAPGASPGGPAASDRTIPRVADLAALAKGDDVAATTRLLRRVSTPTSRITDPQGRPKPHVAGLGEALYTDHLITVELAGTLLFVALIGAISIAAPKPPIRPGVGQAGPSPNGV